MIRKIGVKVILMVVMAVFVTGMIAGTYARYVREASAQGTVKSSVFKLNEDEIKAFNLSIELAPTEMREFVIPVSSEVGVNTMQTVELIGANQAIKPLKYSVFLNDKPVGIKHNRTLAKSTKETVNYKIKVEWPETDNDTAFEGLSEEISFRVKNEQITWSGVSIKVNTENCEEIKSKLLYMSSHYEGANASIIWYTPEPDVTKSFKVASMKLEGNNFNILGENGEQINYSFDFASGYYMLTDEAGRSLSNRCDLFTAGAGRGFYIGHDIDGYGHTGCVQIGYIN
ncbi:MAG: hypothetical protein ACOYWZ_01325 [Bacillota bacterium]